jgi:hypothetical protein
VREQQFIKHQRELGLRLVLDLLELGFRFGFG